MHPQVFAGARREGAQLSSRRTVRWCPWLAGPGCCNENAFIASQRESVLRSATPRELANPPRMPSRSVERVHIARPVGDEE